MIDVRRHSLEDLAAFLRSADVDPVAKAAIRAELRERALRENGKGGDPPDTENRGTIRHRRANPLGEPEAHPIGPATSPRSAATSSAGAIRVPFDLLMSDNRRGSITAATGREKWKAWRDRLADARAQVERQWAGPPLDLAQLDIVIWWPDRRRRDPTNLLKHLLDALKGIVIVDDSWVVLRRLTIETGGIDRSTPAVEIVATAHADVVERMEG